MPSVRTLVVPSLENIAEHLPYTRPAPPAQATEEPEVGFTVCCLYIFKNWISVSTSAAWGTRSLGSLICGAGKN